MAFGLGAIIMFCCRDLVTASSDVEVIDWEPGLSVRTSSMSMLYNCSSSHVKLHSGSQCAEYLLFYEIALLVRLIVHNVQASYLMPCAVRPRT